MPVLWPSCAISLPRWEAPLVLELMLEIRSTMRAKLSVNGMSASWPRHHSATEECTASACSYLSVFPQMPNTARIRAQSEDAHSDAAQNQG